jgi:hypothetical protein
MTKQALAILLGIISAVSAQTFKVDSVTIDSVWNSDTVAYQSARVRRDMKVSFFPVAADSVTCFMDMSYDSGRTWDYNRDLIGGLDNNQVRFRVASNRRNTVIMRVQSGDTAGIVLRVVARKDTASVGNCRITTEIPALRADTAQSFNNFYFSNGTTLANSVDGFYVTYSQNGFVDGIMQYFVSSDSLHTFATVAYDFGLISRASGMFDARKAEWLRKTVIPAYDSTIAAAKMSLRGYAVAAHFNHFYFEFNVNGYDVNGPDSVAAKSDAAKFLDAYQTKVTQLFPNAQSYFQSSGQTVVFDLKAGAHAAWDKNAAAVYPHRSSPGRIAGKTLHETIRSGKISYSIPGIALDSKTTLAIYSLSGNLMDREYSSLPGTFTIKDFIPNGHYVARLEMGRVPLQSTYLTIAR